MYFFGDFEQIDDVFPQDRMREFLRKDDQVERILDVLVDLTIMTRFDRVLTLDC